VDRALDTHTVPAGPIRLLAAGKAAVAMANGAMRRLGDRVRRGVVVAPTYAALDPPLKLARGDHPMPSSRSEAAGREALALARADDDAACLLVLLSGGASALMAVPADGITLEHKQRATDRLLLEGVTIAELNTVRKHLSAVKGGWLAAAANLPVMTLAISDVVGDDPAVIGSGPTVADTSSFEDALSVVRRAGGRKAFPSTVMQRLEDGAAGRLPETPKPGDPRLARSRWWLVGSRTNAMAAAAVEARGRGYAAVVRESAVVGEARSAAAEWAAWIGAPLERSGASCVISSGETTVRVVGSGRGGRNQEFALAAAGALDRCARGVALASVGTDGVDGPTDAAGAIVRSDTLARARAAGLAAPETFLADNNAYAFFAALNDLIRTGPTGTNVGDLQVCLIA
jgi:glycerate-2-kinase